MVVEGGEHSICLFCHLDRKSTFLEDIEGTVSLWEKPQVDREKETKLILQEQPFRVFWLQGLVQLWDRRIFV